MKRICFVVLAVLCLNSNAQQTETSSENTPWLQKMLENRPELDLNKDGILTKEEARNNPDRKKNQQGPGILPTHTNVLYGEHEDMVLDFWQAESDTPTPLFVWIHGGGFRGGDKNPVNQTLLKGFLEAGVSVASINYRLTHIGPYPMQMHDGARAIQFLRSKAGKWNIDPKRVAAGGGSAGSGISQWLAFHDDLADPKGDDPVARQSTRLTCALPINMQSTYDPRVVKNIIPGKAYTNAALLPFYGLPESWDWDSDKIDAELDALIKDASPINHLTADDPPVFLIHYEKARKPGNIHHPNFGEYLKKAMDKLGIECIRRMDSDYPSMDEAYKDMVRFVTRHFETD